MSHRCSICNSVSDYNLSDSVSKYNPGKYQEDPSDSSAMICDECYVEYSEVLGELNEAEDEVDPTVEFWEHVIEEALEEELKE